MERGETGRDWGENEMVSFLLAGDLRPLKLRGARSQNSEDICREGNRSLPILTLSVESCQ